MNNEIYLKKVKELISQLEERQASLGKTDYGLNNKIMFIQALKAKLEIDDHINISKVEEILNRETEEVKELLYPQTERLLHNQAEKAKDLLHNQAEKAKELHNQADTAKELLHKEAEDPSTLPIEKTLDLFRLRTNKGAKADIE